MRRRGKRVGWRRSVRPTARGRDAAATDSVLTDVLGTHAKVKILTALLSETDRDLNATEIARLAGIDRTTFYDHVDDLLAYEMIERTRTVANSQMYRINRDNPAAEALATMEWELLEYVEEESPS